MNLSMEFIKTWGSRTHLFKQYVAHHPQPPQPRSPFWKDECSSQSSLIVWNGSAAAITPLPTDRQSSLGFLGSEGTRNAIE